MQQPTPGEAGAEERRTVTVAEAMTPCAVTVPAGATVAEAVGLLGAAHASGAPVLEGTHLVGVVTMRDLLGWASAADPHELDWAAAARWTGPGSLRRVRVGNLLTYRPVTAQPDLPARRALALMELKRLQRLPVVDDRGLLVGVVARDALAARLARQG